MLKKQIGFVVLMVGMSCQRQSQPIKQVTYAPTTQPVQHTQIQQKTIPGLLIDIPLAENKNDKVEPAEPEGCDYNLSNPPPLLVEYTTQITPYSNICISVNYRPDIGAYEYIPPFEPLKIGDFSMNGKVTTYDFYWFQLCYSGPNVPIRQTLKKNGIPVSAACWLCDLDQDEDVDQDDFGLFQAQLTETYLWGDANLDGVVNTADATFVQNCITNDPYPNPPNPCYKADLNENLGVSDKDLELVNQAIQRQQ